jgi:hypothetical protein
MLSRTVMPEPNMEGEAAVAGDEVDGRLQAGG